MKYELTLCLLKDKEGKIAGFSLGAGPETYSENFVDKLAKRMKKVGTHAVYIQPKSITFVLNKEDRASLQITEEISAILRDLILQKNLRISCETTWLPRLKIINEKMADDCLEDVVCSKTPERI